MLGFILQYMAIRSVYPCNEFFCSIQRENNICDPLCNTQMCDFDQAGFDLYPFTSPCISDCYATACGEILSTNDQCDQLCNNPTCGFDWGKCGFCDSGCNI